MEAFGFKGVEVGFFWALGFWVSVLSQGFLYVGLKLRLPETVG